jgi:hypothetical protein
MVNPFAFHGTLARGSNFAGRRRQIAIAQQRCLGNEQACLAIVGMPRVGKSSLADRVFIEPRRELFGRQVLTAWVQVSVQQKPAELFVQIAWQTMESIREAARGGNGGSMVPLLERALVDVRADAEWVDLNLALARFFSAVRETGYRTVVVLDEFDHTRVIFRSMPAAFHLLRELGNNPTYGIGLVAVSRRPVAEIEEVACPGNSNLDGIFLELQVPCFNDDEMRELLGPLDEIGAPRSELDGVLSEYCGYQPYFATVVAFHAAQQWLTDRKLNMAEIIESAEPTLYREYGHILALLEERGLKEKLLEVLFGPNLQVMPADLSQMRQYGIIRGRGDVYAAFAPHFHSYLSSLSRDVDLWPLWTQAEQALRRCLHHVLAEKYATDEWGDSVRRDHANLADLVKRLTLERGRYMARNPAPTGSRLIDYANPSDYMPLISSYWKVLQAVLGEDRGIWNSRFELLAWVRRPIAHSNVKFVQKEDRLAAESICHSLIRLIEKWEKTQAV